jgi:signal transduction histidine kinase
VRDAPPHIDALEVFAEVLSQDAEELDQDAFYGALCDAVCRLASMRRAVIFRYDPSYRRVRAVGSHGIELAPFNEEAHLGVELAPITSIALTEDRVVVASSEMERKVPGTYTHLLDHALLVCTPMVAAGQWVGVILSEREDSEPLGGSERYALWTLGKVAALAATARIATWQTEKARQLQQRIDLARDIHDNVVQRLFGVSLALSGADSISGEALDRAATEIQEALAELRTVVQRPLGRELRATKATLAHEIERLRHLYPGLGIQLDHGDPADVPEHLQPLAQSILAEAVRNADKHAEPTRVGVSLGNDDDTFVLSVVNDGVRPRDSEGNGWGMGLRLATLEAVQLGGFVEFGENRPGTWEVRLVVPNGSR